MVHVCRLRARTAAANRCESPRDSLLGILFSILLFLPGLPGFADNARFDLTGPKVDVRVTRRGITLPIASVPNLQAGDRLWIHPDLPSTQSVRYLMVLAFLRGTTNPPPDHWFYRIETWDKKVRAEGVEIVVPNEAQQAVLFLAPVTGGDFTTLRSTVQGRPGIFVRASQDLAAAGFEQARIEKYISVMHELSPADASDAKELQKRSNLIATTLALKPNGDCINLPSDQQYTCLTQSGSQSLLEDGHGQSLIATLTGDNGAGFINQASYTQVAGAGMYSAYVGSIVDLVHIMGSLHVAQYQYIPAIAFPQQDALNLRLNTPPSFHNPKSVIVIGLPSIKKTVPPPLRASDPEEVSCLRKPGMVLHVEGAPLVFSTGFAHDLILHLNYPHAIKPDASQPINLPLTPDAFRGGLVLSSIPKRHELPEEAFKPQAALPPAPADGATAENAQGREKLPHAELTGTVMGYWGFDPFTGPTMPLQRTPGGGWKIVNVTSEDNWLIAGKTRQLSLTSSGTACVESIDLEQVGKQSSQPQHEDWKSSQIPNIIDLSLNVPAQDSGVLQLNIHQYGDPKPATLSLRSYSEPAKLTSLVYHAGDSVAVLHGSGLEQVKQVELSGSIFSPPTAADNTSNANESDDSLRLKLANGSNIPSAPMGHTMTAQIALKDGRTLDLPMTIQSARPAVALINRADQLPSGSTASSELPIKIGNDTDLPVHDTLIFSMQSQQAFPRTGSIEIASPDGSLHTTLTSAKGSLILEDPNTLLGTLRPLKAFGPAAFGPVRLRPVMQDGTAGDWLPLVTLVRLPSLSEISCPVQAAPPPLPRSKAPPSAKTKPSRSEKSAAVANTPAATPPDEDATAAPVTAQSLGDVSGAAPASNSAPATSPASSTSDHSATANNSNPAADAKASGSETAGSDATAVAASSQSGTPPSSEVESTSSSDVSVVAQPALCKITGSGLYFLDSISSDPAFTNAIHVPEGFVGSSISVPVPKGAVLYLKLRDDPSVVDTVTLPAGPL